MIIQTLLQEISVSFCFGVGATKKTTILLSFYKG